MRSRRSRPLFIAPLIPLLGIAGIFGVQQFHGTRWLGTFVVVWCVMLAVLFTYVLSQALNARRVGKAKP